MSLWPLLTASKSGVFPFLSLGRVARGSVMAAQIYDQHLHSRHSWDCESDPGDKLGC